MVILQAFFKLIRWPNLLIIALVQYMIRFFITESLDIPHMLNHLEYAYGVICSITLAAAGYIINDIYDLEVDRQNKPQRMVLGKQISVQNAWTVYIVLNIIAVVTGYLVSEAAGYDDLWLLPILAIVILYFYALNLKKRPVIGNLVVSLLTALPVFFVGLFDLLPAIEPESQSLIRTAFYVICGYSLFAFWVNFIREIVKDTEDINGDKRQGYKTLAVLLGVEYIRYVIAILGMVLLVFIGYFNAFMFFEDLISSIYLLIFVSLPVAYFIVRVFRAKRTKDFKKLSLMLKYIMLTGILSMAIFTLSLQIQT